MGRAVSSPAGTANTKQPALGLRQNRGFLPTPPAFDTPIRRVGSCRNIAMTFGAQKPEWCGYSMVKKIHYDRILERAGRTDTAQRHRLRLHRIARQKTVFGSTSRQHRHWPSSEVTSRLISSGAAFHNFTAVPLCLGSYATLLLLTYFNMCISYPGIRTVRPANCMAAPLTKTCCHPTLVIDDVGNKCSLSWQRATVRQRYRKRK